MTCTRPPSNACPARRWPKAVAPLRPSTKRNKKKWRKIGCATWLAVASSAVWPAPISEGPHRHTSATLQLHSQHQLIELAVGRGQDLHHFDQILDEEVEVVHIRIGEETLGGTGVPREERRVMIRMARNTGKRTTMESIGDAPDLESDKVDQLSWDLVQQGAMWLSRGCLRFCARMKIPTPLVGRRVERVSPAIPSHVTNAWRAFPRPTGCTSNGSELTCRRQSCALARSAMKAHARCTRFARSLMTMMFF